MIKEFVPYAEALELKQLGFNEPCFGWYLLAEDEEKQMLVPEKCPKQEIGLCLAPTYSQGLRWFREKHQIVCVIDFYNDGDLWEDTMYTVTISEFEHFKSHDSFVQFEYKTYEEAELACLRKLISTVKQKP